MCLSILLLTRIFQLCIGFGGLCLLQRQGGSAMFQASIFLASKLPCSGPLLPCLPGSWTLYATDNFYFLVGLGLAAAVIDKFTLYVTLYVPGTGVHGYITLSMSVAWVKPEVELR